MLNEKQIEELAYKLPINNIETIIWHKNNSIDRSLVKLYKVKLVKQFLKLMEEIKND